MSWATVYTDVYLPLGLKVFSKLVNDELIRSALAKVRMSDLSKVRPRQLLGDMKMRCSIARAMMTEPKLMLMDKTFIDVPYPCSRELSTDMGFQAIARDLSAPLQPALEINMKVAS